MFLKIFWVIVASVVAYLMVRFRFKFTETFGPISLLEKYLGSTETGVVLFAILIFLWSLMNLTGTFEGFLYSIFGRFF